MDNSANEPQCGRANEVGGKFKSVVLLIVKEALGS